jgi:hypothetical protein
MLPTASEFEHWRQVPSPSNTLWVMPEIGTTHKYKLSCFPNIWEDTVALGKDIQKIGQQKSPHLNFRIQTS